MHLASRVHLDALVAGTGEEEGRIGFVAATRARDLRFVGVPKKTKDDVIAVLRGFELTEWGQTKLATSPQGGQSGTEAGTGR